LTPCCQRRRISLAIGRRGFVRRIRSERRIPLSVEVRDLNRVSVVVIDIPVHGAAHFRRLAPARPTHRTNAVRLLERVRRNASDLCVPSLILNGDSSGRRWFPRAFAVNVVPFSDFRAAFDCVEGRVVAVELGHLKPAAAPAELVLRPCYSLSFFWRSMRSPRTPKYSSLTIVLRASNWREMRAYPPLRGDFGSHNRSFGFPFVSK
jgi:hypothetical protein